MPRTVIEVRGVKKFYPLGREGVWALRGVSFTIRAGEMVAIMGPSGSRKSTLLHILGCLDTPTEGEYILAGKAVAQLNDR